MLKRVKYYNSKIKFNDKTVEKFIFYLRLLDLSIKYSLLQVQTYIIVFFCDEVIVPIINIPQRRKIYSTFVKTPLKNLQNSLRL